jgi:hypothetical protein
MVFTVLSLAQLGHVMAIRSEKEISIKNWVLFSNPTIAGDRISHLPPTGLCNFICPLQTRS